jgi:hypothetical protein
MQYISAGARYLLNGSEIDLKCPAGSGFETYII